MWSFDRKFSLIAAVSAVLLLSVASGCKGFFVNSPTSVTVSPTNQSLSSIGATQPFSAIAAFSDNTTKTVTSSATWTSSNTCVVAILTPGAGISTGIGNATAVGTGGGITITASYAGVSGTATATAPSGLIVTPATGSCPIKVVGSFPRVVFTHGTTQTFTATGGSGTITWASDDTSVITITNSGNSGDATFVGLGTADITGTDSTGTKGTLQIVVQ